jgi:SnoaL-like domain
MDAINAHDVKSILACFNDDAVVRDENATHRGKIDIERWLMTTIEKYKFHFKLLSSQECDNGTVVSVEVSGTFSGSPNLSRLPLRHYRQQNHGSHDRFMTGRITKMAVPKVMFEFIGFNQSTSFVRQSLRFSVAKTTAR